MTRTGEMRICSLIRVVILSAMGLFLSCLRISHLCRANIPSGLLSVDLGAKTNVQISPKGADFANGRAGSSVGNRCRRCNWHFYLPDSHLAGKHTCPPGRRLPTMAVWHNLVGIHRLQPY